MSARLVTTFVDATGLLIYFGIAQLLDLWAAALPTYRASGAGIRSA